MIELTCLPITYVLSNVACNSETVGTPASADLGIKLTADAMTPSSPEAP